MPAVDLPGPLLIAVLLGGGSGYVLARYFFIADPDGYKIEILQRRGRYR